MIFDQLAFHNVAELPAAPGGGRQLARFPSDLWGKVESPYGHEAIRSGNGSEIQFVSDSPRIRFYLRSLVGEAQLVHMMGNHVLARETLDAGKLHCLEITRPDFDANLDPAVRRAGGYDPTVYRIVLVGATLAYHGVDPMGGNLRPPKPKERPKLRWLAYGSSITQASDTYDNFVNHTAQLLEVAPLNLGMGGACWIEPAMTDFIAGRDDWDFATFELGINLVDGKRDHDQFRERVDYLLKAVTRKHPNKPIFLLTTFNNGARHEIRVSDWQRDLLEKDEILRETAVVFSPQVVLLEGTEIATDLTGFRADLLHPQPFAHARMAIHLSQAIHSDGRLTNLHSNDSKNLP